MHKLIHEMSIRSHHKQREKYVGRLFWSILFTTLILLWNILLSKSNNKININTSIHSYIFHSIKNNLRQLLPLSPMRRLVMGFAKKKSSAEEQECERKRRRRKKKHWSRISWEEETLNPTRSPISNQINH